MLFGFINRISGAAGLRDGLDASSARTKAIADRVAKASLGNADGFAATAAKAGAANTDPNAPKVDLETEMTSLADEQLRYEATAKMLEKTYAQMRTVIRGQ